MENDQSPAVWTVDLIGKQVSRDDVVIDFREVGDMGMQISFVSEHSSSSEEQCLIAGDAIAAIKKARGQL